MHKKLGVNIDHIATVRQARKAEFPDPVQAAFLAELGGADGITAHLREDRRHIQDRDIYLLRNTVKTILNMEMALVPEIIEIALKVVPDEVCIVPERREEVTTEGGLNAVKNLAELKKVVPILQKKGILVSLFIDAEPAQIDAARDCGSSMIEIHTGKYADAKSPKSFQAELEKVWLAAKYAASLGLQVNAGHGLHYKNVEEICRIPEIHTLNIGHSIVARALSVGMKEAVRDMIEAMNI